MSMSRTPLYIDLGSSNTRIFQGDTSIFVEPSCLVLKDGQTRFIGQKASELLGKVPAPLELIFPVRYGQVDDQTKAKQFLQAIDNDHLARSWWQSWRGRSGYALVQASASKVEKERLHKVLRSVWAGSWQLVKRPLAILSSIESQVPSSDTICLIDIGGQTTELSLLMSGQVVLSTVVEWGGVELTELIQKQIWSQFESAVSWQTAEQIKREQVLLSTNTTKTSGRTTVRGKDIVRQVGTTTVVEMAKISPVIEKQVDSLVDEIKLFISQASSQLTGGLVDSGLWLTGGGSLLQGLKEMLSERLRYPVKITPNPELDAIFGLRMQKFGEI
jgi:rod shape-determining protein MreB and related proteins